VQRPLYWKPLRGFQRFGFEEQFALGYEQALVSLKLKKTVDGEVGRTPAVRIEGG